MKAKLLFLHALSPLHAGTGQGVGAIDLPIAREKATGIPIVPGSSIKGVLRSNCEDDALKIRVFGPETENASDHAGSAQFSDLRLLFLPVRSLAGTFAWVTSPLLLQRLQRDCKMADTHFASEVPVVKATDECLVSATDSQLLTNVKRAANKVVLEDLLLQGQPAPTVDDLLNWLKPLLFGTDAAWGELFAERLCVVHDDVLSFLLDTATEVTARIRLDDEKKTVVDGALWYEEALPAESILSGLMVVQKIEASEEDVLSAITKLARSPLQVGGSATVGRGLCRLRLVS
ncbi:MAG: type III-B CRISPR module RAMP protein Cmr4 [Chloroflexota bacterium]|nr:type III-B CRISPR module RAMP protein Cmr4 [Chloroflexota bacterium]